MADVVGSVFMASVIGLGVGFGIGSVIAPLLDRYQSLDPEDPPMLHRLAAYCFSALQSSATAMVAALSATLREHVLSPATQLLHAFSADLRERVHGAWASLLVMATPFPVCAQLAIAGAGFPHVACRAGQVRLRPALHDAVPGPGPRWWEQRAEALWPGHRWPPPREPACALAL